MGRPVHLKVYWPVLEGVTPARRAQRVGMLGLEDHGARAPRTVRTRIAAKLLALTDAYYA